MPYQSKRDLRARISELEGDLKRSRKIVGSVVSSKDQAPPPPARRRTGHVIDVTWDATAPPSQRFAWRIKYVPYNYEFMTPYYRNKVELPSGHAKSWIEAETAARIALVPYQVREPAEKPWVHTQEVAV